MGETNSSKAATPLTNTQALQWGGRGVATTTHGEVGAVVVGFMATTRQRLEMKGEGRVGGNKERKRWRLLSWVYLPVALVAVWQKRLSVSPLICCVSQRVDGFITPHVIIWERQQVESELPAWKYGSHLHSGGINTTWASVFTIPVVIFLVQIRNVVMHACHCARATCWSLV